MDSSHISHASSSHGSSRSSLDDDTKRFVQWRKFTLFAACFIPFGAQFAKQCISPLRPYFEEQGFTANQFAMFLSAPSWPNLIQPLVMPLFVDSRGHESGAIIFSAFSLLGHALFAASLSLHVDYGILVGVCGRVLFGLGQGGSGIVQGAILGSHFENDLSFAIGLSQSVKNLSNWLGRLAPVMLAEWFDSNFLVPIWFCCMLLMMSCVLAVVHVMFEEVHRPFTYTFGNPHAQHLHYSLDREPKDLVIASPPSTARRGLWTFVRTAPMAFWGINLLHFLFSNTAGLFTGFSTSFYIQEYGISVQTAAFLSSLDALTPIIVAPIVGKVVDRYGGRMSLLIGFAMCDVICFVLFARYGNTLVGGAWLPTIMLAIAASAPSTLLKSCIPLICREKQDMVLAFSIYFVFENIGHAIGQLVLGHLKSVTLSFQANLEFLCGVSLCAVVCTFAIKKYDEWRWGGMLSRAAATTVAVS